MIAVSQATATDLVRLYSVPPERIRIVYEAAPASDAIRRRSPLRSAPPLSLARPYALYVGTIQPRKNLERLVRAYARLAAADDLAWDLVLAGKPGWLSDPLVTLAHDLRVDHRVHFLGYVQDECCLR